jgi:LacI family fructose operon transcriptional repressor
LQQKKTLKRAACEQGIRIFLCNTDEDPAKEPRYLKLMREERIAGIILLPAHKNKQ